jgi:hypothetical protein
MKNETIVKIGQNEAWTSLAATNSSINKYMVLYWDKDDLNNFNTYA